MKKLVLLFCAKSQKRAEKVSRRRERAHHEVDLGTKDPASLLFRARLVVLAETAVAPEPAERTLHDPALGKYDEPLCPWSLWTIGSQTPSATEAQSAGARW